MKQLTLKVEHLYGIDEEFNNYMLNFNGIKSVNVDNDTLNIDIKYDEKCISINRIKLETMFFLGLNRIPSLLAFDKHFETNHLENRVMIIKDLCCEYCLKGMIEELLELDWISQANSDYFDDYINKNNVHINISYDKQLVSEKELKELEEKLNEY